MTLFEIRITATQPYALILHHCLKPLLMKNIFFFLFGILITISFASCDNDDDNCGCNDGNIVGKWEAKEFLSLESRGYSKDDDYEPIIEFKKDGTIDIRLDANGCFGDFELIGETGINISNTGCTEMCCDSDFSTKFSSMLSQVSSYEIKNNVLKLNVSGWGWINLEWVSD